MRDFERAGELPVDEDIVQSEIKNEALQLRLDLEIRVVGLGISWAVDMSGKHRLAVHCGGENDSVK